MSGLSFGKVIEIDGDDEISGIGRANDLVITRHLRESMGVGLWEARAVNVGLRTLQFKFDDTQLKSLLSQNGLDAGTDMQSAVRQGLQNALAEIEKCSPLELVYV